MSRRKNETGDRILLVDDEPSTRVLIRSFLESSGYQILEAATCLEVQNLLAEEHPDAVILDYRLPDGDALELLPIIKEAWPDTPVLILTGHGSIDLAVHTIKLGAEQFLTKPVELESIRILLSRVLSTKRERNMALLQQRQVHQRLDPFLGRSPAILRLRAQAEQIAAVNYPVLIEGETGSGKGLLARWIHEHSPRRQEPLVDLNCAGLGVDFLESELFGHEKGAFTGAIAPKRGLLEVAHRGTVFFDEIGDMQPQVQAKVLKVVEEKSFRRLGGLKDRKVDIRLVAATHRDLNEEVRQERFRADLLFRIATVPIRVPSLRERPEDIADIARLLLGSVAVELGRPGLALDRKAEEKLVQYSWPGNVRELKNTLERAAILSKGTSLLPQHFALGSPEPSRAQGVDTTLTLQQSERLLIEAVTDEEGGNISRAARRLGIHRSTLHEKLRKLGTIQV